MDKLQKRLHLISFTVRVLIIAYFAFWGIQLAALFMGGIQEESTQTDGSELYGHNYCGTFFIEITRNNSFIDEESYLEAKMPAETSFLQDVIMNVSLLVMIVLLLIFLHRADKQTLFSKRSAWLLITTGIIYAAGETYLEFEKLSPDVSVYKGIMASQSYYPQIIYSVYGIVLIMLAYGLILLNYEQSYCNKNTVSSVRALKIIGWTTGVIALVFVLCRLSERIYEIANAVFGGNHNARLPFYSVFLDLPTKDAVSESAYIKVLIFRFAKDLPVFAAAVFGVFMLIKLIFSAVKGYANTPHNRKRLKKAALALALSSLAFNLLGLVEAELIRESFTGIYSTAVYTIGIRAGCEPMLFAFLLIALETYIQVIPEKT